MTNDNFNYSEASLGDVLRRLDHLNALGCAIADYLADNVKEDELGTLFCWIFDKLERQHDIDSHSIVESVAVAFPQVFDLFTTNSDDSDDEPAEDEWSLWDELDD